MQSTWSAALEGRPDPAQRETILNALVGYNDATAGPGGWQPLCVTVRDAQGATAGGLWGYTLYGFLFIEMLALGPARGQGLGRQVMQLAEDEARRRGAQGIWLDSWTFQAPGFYQKLGFTEFGRIEGYPAGHDRVFLLKRLGRPPGAAHTTAPAASPGTA